MDVLQVVAQLERVVRQSQNLPWFWSDRSVIHKERFLRLLAELHKALPEEIAQAQSLVERQNNLLESAKSEAQKIVSEAQDRARDLTRAAQEEAARLVQETDIVAAAKVEARKIVEAAQERVAELKSETLAAIEKRKKEAQAELQTLYTAANNYLQRAAQGLEQEGQRTLEAAKRLRQNIEP